MSFVPGNGIVDQPLVSKTQTEPPPAQNDVGQHLMDTQQKILDAILQSQLASRARESSALRPIPVKPDYVIPRSEPKIVAFQERAMPVGPLVPIPYNIIFNTRSFGCERLSSHRLCFSVDEKSCVIVTRNGRVPDYFEVRRFSSDVSILSPRDWDRVSARCQDFAIYEVESL